MDAIWQHLTQLYLLILLQDFSNSEVLDIQEYALQSHILSIEALKVNGRGATLDVWRLEANV